MRTAIQNDPRIGPEGVEYISKAQAFQEMKQKEPDIVSGVATNPLPDAFRIKPKHGDDVVAIANSLKPLPPGVEKVNFGKKTAKRILRVAHIFEVLSALAIAILLIAATILIGKHNWISVAVLAAATAAIDAIYLSPRAVPAKFLVPGTIFLVAFQLVPILLFALGAGSQMLQPLAIAVIGGVLISMILSLVITPAVHFYIGTRSSSRPAVEIPAQ